MSIEEDRKEWDIHRDKLDIYVNGIMEGMRRNGAPQVTLMSVDIAFRSFVYWVGAAHHKRVEPNITRDTLVNLISVMIMDLALRMNDLDGIHPRLEITNWARELISDVATHVMDDIKEVTEDSQRRPM
jgi:hypothetical protein